MPLIRNFEDVMAWQEARKLVKQTYQLTRTGDLSKDFGMRDQMQRAAISVMNNIAEGFDCQSNVEFARFLVIARRSAVEIQSMLYAAHDIGYIDEKVLKELYSQASTTKTLINALKRSLKVPAQKPF
jgi:four helix bundle protein